MPNPIPESGYVPCVRIDAHRPVWFDRRPLRDWRGHVGAGCNDNARPPSIRSPRAGAGCRRSPGRYSSRRRQCPTDVRELTRASTAWRRMVRRIALIWRALRGPGMFAKRSIAAGRPIGRASKPIATFRVGPDERPSAWSFVDESGANVSDGPVAAWLPAGRNWHSSSRNWGDNLSLHRGRCAWTPTVTLATAWCAMSRFDRVRRQPPAAYRPTSW